MDNDREMTMKMLKYVLCILLLLLYVPIVLAVPNTQQIFYHKMDVAIQPETGDIRVTDQIRLPEKYRSHSKKKSVTLDFSLHGNLVIESVDGATLISHNQSGEYERAHVPLKQYTLKVSPKQSTVTLTYQGKINHTVQQAGAYDRSSSYTPGVISGEGVFLANSTVWYPRFDEPLVSFQLNITLPKGWDAVSQGQLVTDKNTSAGKNVVWEENNPQDDIYIIAGQYQRYAQPMTGDIDAMVYLRSADAALAQKYLDTTAHYITLYNNLIGAYPYSKFALVENFWETGYGMPSFTLLGPRVIRFPFIMHSSYPHEILHNYWGNGVFIDYNKGNWSEGLTAYLADHLIKEQNGKGVEYRRDVLQKYTDFVSNEKDFPIIRFVSKHSSSSEAVGYGKTLMFFHMLRQELGDKDFVRALREFYKTHLFTQAGFDDLKTVFNKVANKDLTNLFQQWVTQSGAPSLVLQNVDVKKSKQGFQLKAMIKQTHNGLPYTLKIPVAVHLQGHDKAFQTHIDMTKREQAINLALPAQPIRIDIDPQFDVFRRLDSREIPSALSQGFGAKSPLFILPSQADEAVQQAYSRLAQAWRRTRIPTLTTIRDDQLDAVPTDRMVWIMGWENKFRQNMLDALSVRDVTLEGNQLLLNNKQYALQQHSIMLTARQPDNPGKTLLWVAADNPETIMQLARKLPHYRKYSFLVFVGKGATNIEKGQWQILHSPLSQFVSADHTKLTSQLKARKALAE